MVNVDGVSAIEQLAGDDDHSTVRSPDRRPDPACEIHAVVTALHHPVENPRRSEPLVVAPRIGRANRPRQSRGVWCVRRLISRISSRSASMRALRDSGGWTNRGAVRSVSRRPRRGFTESDGVSTSTVPRARWTSTRIAAVRAAASGTAASARCRPALPSKCSGSPATSPRTATTLSPAPGRTTTTTSDPWTGVAGCQVTDDVSAAACAIARLASLAHQASAIRVGGSHCMARHTLAPCSMIPF